MSAALSPTFRAVPVSAASVRVDGARECRRRPAGGSRYRSPSSRRGRRQPCGKTDWSLRAVPLPARAAQALDEHATRFGIPRALSRDAKRPSGALTLGHREWNPALSCSRARASLGVRAPAHAAVGDAQRDPCLHLAARDDPLPYDLTTLGRSRTPSFAGCSVGAPRFELGTSSPPD